MKSFVFLLKAFGILAIGLAWSTTTFAYSATVSEISSETEQTQHVENSKKGHFYFSQEAETTVQVLAESDFLGYGNTSTSFTSEVFLHLNTTKNSAELFLQDKRKKLRESIFPFHFFS